MKNKILMLLIVASFNIFAGGFQINEHNARALGMANAYTGYSVDPSAVYFNSAGISFLSGTRFMLGTTLINPKSSFRGVTPDVTEYKAADQIFTPVYLFATHNFNNDFAIGLGFTVPFGLGTKWDENWIGKYLAIETEVMIFTLSPVVSYKVMDNLAISAGLTYSFANVLITRKAPQTPFAGDAFVELEGSESSAFGYNFGLMYKPVTDLSIGVSFHSEIEYEFKGTATSEGAAQLASRLPNGDIEAGLTTPFNLAIGLAYTGFENLALSADVQYVGWESYDTLAVNFNNPTLTDIASPRLYENNFIARLGGEYHATNKLDVRAGIYFDKNPVKTEYLNPSLPEGDRLGFTFGLGYKFTPNLAVDAAYLFIRAEETTVSNSHENYRPGVSPFNGTYNSSAHLLSLGFSYNL